MLHFLRMLRRDTHYYRPVSYCLLSIFCVILFLFTSCGANGDKTSTGPQESVQPAPPLKGVLGSVHMFTTTSGWAVSQSVPGSGSYSILRTSDGGAHWRVMLNCLSTQAAGKAFVVPCVTDFHSATVATVLAPLYDQKTRVSSSRIYHTSNGGLIWQSSVVDARYLETPPVFVDADHGWFLATDHFPGLDPGSSYIGGRIALYRTSDGGLSWQRVVSGPSTSQLPTTSDDAYGVAPLAANARLQFTSPQTGWLTGTTYHGTSSQGWLYTTHDAGNSWHLFTLPNQSAATSLSQPLFFTAQTGLLLASTTGPGPAFAPTARPYITHDGGKSWQPSGVSTKFQLMTNNFVDLQHAWTQEANTSDRLFYTTADGGRNWLKHAFPSHFNRYSSLDFVTADVGWVIAMNINHPPLPEPGGGLRKGDVSVLLQTKDGGQSWHEVARMQL
ncbi:sialidase family protein [Dictyobacter kobayashii]|uniref:Photosynthesis system II assembly factor Ycf48/Hcf136-like domain-containing protein n=1 Tax=Dictyobacter kobayashii TaxID=2014872 RepID=A0A402APN5_9CHLR|nr:hypothetical protein [Dictyobacter kobayashii]GCE21077.1 hypothetical protein KDK_48770 [Dictyobacter kobayashii]